VELNRRIEKRGQIFNKDVRKAATSKEDERKRCGLNECSIIYDTRPFMTAAIQAPRTPQVGVAKDGFVI
jgi:hypothetical protein